MSSDELRPDGAADASVKLDGVEKPRADNPASRMRRPWTSLMVRGELAWITLWIIRSGPICEFQIYISKFDNSVLWLVLLNKVPRPGPRGSTLIVSGYG